MNKKKSLAGEQKENMTKELKARESATGSPKPTGTTQPNRFEEIPVIRHDLEGLVQVTDALQAIEVLLSYVGNRGQDGGDDGANAAWTAIGLASAVSIANAHIKNFQDLVLHSVRLRTRKGEAAT